MAGRKIVISVSAAVGITVALYLGFAFAVWNMNAARWDDSTRVLLVFLVFTFAPVGALLGSLFEEAR